MTDGNGGNGKFIGWAVTIAAAAALLVGWGMSYGTLSSRVDRNSDIAQEACNTANRNTGDLIGVKKDTERILERLNSIQQYVEKIATGPMP